MTATDVTEILRKLDSALDRLARIEERTNVLADHEARIRAAEESARVAGETAVQAKGIAEGHAVRIRALEDSQRVSFGALGRVLVGAGGLIVVAVTVLGYVQGS